MHSSRVKFSSILFFDRRRVDFLSFSLSLSLGGKSLPSCVLSLVCLESNRVIGMHNANLNRFIYESAGKVHHVCS